MTEDPELLDAVSRRLPPGATLTREQPRIGFAAVGGVVKAQDPDGLQTTYLKPVAEGPLVRLASVMQKHIALHAPRHTFIRAGVVSLEGVGIVIPGKSRNGKTTLVAALLGLGATYYSDEFAVVDAAGLIHPWAKPLSVRASATDELGVPESRPPARSATQPIRAGLIIDTCYQQGERWNPTPTIAGAAAELLLANAPSARFRPAEALKAAAQLARDARALSGPRGEANDMAVALRSFVRQGSLESKARLGP